MNDQELSALYKKLVKNKCSEEEAELLLALLADKANDSDFKKLVIDQLSQQPAKHKEDELSESSKIFLDATLKEILNSDVQQTAPKKIKSLKNRLLYAAAATLLFSIAVYFFIKNEPKSALVVNKQKHLIVPGGNKAILTLSNGEQVNLADASNGNIATQAGTIIKKTKNGMLVYQNDNKTGTGNNEGAEPLYNTITTPKGGQYQVLLPDGSKVWLNALSSLKYPVTFNQHERLVELSGEGYFEITTIQQPTTAAGKKGNIPFIVMSNQQKIEVLGTKFNVNAYIDEASIKTTLLKGSVKISVLNQNSRQAPTKLVPGQQSEVSGNSININEVNTEYSIAWKNGLFQFENEDIHVVMRKIARWYNIEVQYDGNMTGKVFSGTISKYEDVNEVLKMLQLTGCVSFKIKDRKIIVS